MGHTIVRRARSVGTQQSAGLLTMVRRARSVITQQWGR